MRHLLVPVLAVLFPLIPACPVMAQSGTQNEELAPVHDRHLARHGLDLPAAHDPARFTTNRVSPIQLPLPGEEDAFFFVVYGDRTGGPDAGINVLKDAVRDTNLLEPDLVMTVGDMIQGYNDTPLWMDQMREFKGVMDELACPWFPVAGNHDVYWRGPEGQKPVGEHEGSYEMHFGPLWYAFEHKNCWFIALYSDEGNPQTGEKGIGNPDSQRMSQAQFDWLRETLGKAKDAEHVFLFLHHPRWLGNNYGDDWNKVHELLVSAGNVSAVFAGHIHRMRYDPKDGIEYVTLATVGGHNQKTVPDAGWLHHFNVVTVRDGRIALAAVPVGEVLDVREITGDFATEITALASTPVVIPGVLALGADNAVDQLIEVPLTNSTSKPAEFTVIPESGDSRWLVSPDHMHVELAAGESVTAEFRVRRGAAPLDATFRPLAMAVDIEVLMPGHRYAVPTILAETTLQIDAERLPTADSDLILSLSESGHAEVPNDLAAVPEGPFTLEAWFKADELGRRTGLVSKTEGSDYGLFVSEGRPHFAVHVGGEYAVAESAEPMIQPGRWHHIAGVYDGSEVRAYLDGSLVVATPAAGERQTNELPLMIGADVDRRGRGTSTFRGQIASVRLSSAVRYTGEQFEPAQVLGEDADTALLFDMDRSVGPWLVNEGRRGGLARLRDRALLTPAP
jgi:hypothetical protein